MFYAKTFPKMLQKCVLGCCTHDKALAKRLQKCFGHGYM